MTEDQLLLDQVTRARHGALLKSLSMTASDALGVIDALGVWWREEAVRLEGSRKRADASARKDASAASRAAETLAAALLRLGSDVELTPSESEVPAFLDPPTRHVESLPTPDAVRRLTWQEVGPVTLLDPPEHRSVSQVTTWEGCGMRYRLQRRMPGVSGRPMWSAIGGRALHKAIEVIETGSPADWAATLHAGMADTASGTHLWPMSTWHAASRGAEGYTWWLANGSAMLDRYRSARDVWVESGWELVLAEAQVGLAIDDLPPIVGIIDQVWRHTDTGELRVRDVKTGKRRPDDDLQLKIYSLALDSSAELITADYWMARYGEPTPALVVDPEVDRAEIVYRVGSMDAADRAAIHPVRRSMYCPACPVEAYCPARADR